MQMGICAKKRKTKQKTPTKRKLVNEEDSSEAVCFFCKDGGDLRICDFKGCVKAYHPECVGKEESFLDDDNYWKCGWHSCMHCGKSPKFHCYCCPKAVCGRCLCDVDFAVVTDTRGFCQHCLTLAGFIERTKTPNPGEDVDFDAADSYEYFFKYYWEGGIKETEGLTAEHLVSAEKRLKKDTSDREIESDPISSAKEDSSGSSESSWNASDHADVNSGNQRKARCRGKVSQEKHPVKMKRFMSKKKEFSGWGSKVLVEFLVSIGKDTSQQLSQHEVAEIIKRYSVENNLFDPEKKKKILCDAKLNMLFGRKSVNKNRILGNLTKHFADNQSDDDLDIAEDDWFVADDEENVEVAYKKQRVSTSEADCQDKVAAVPIVKKSCFASVTASNMKLVYLKRHVVEELSNDSEDFDAKVIGSFVRVKADPFDYSQKNSHLLVQVRGVRRQIGESKDSILLQVSDMMGEIPICKVTDENFTEEECQDLRQRVKDGLLKRPVVVEFEEKARVLHEAITKDWIRRELIILKRLIDQASVKGWRRELAEYLEKLGKLQKPEEQARLLQEIPAVVADEEEVEPASEVICEDKQEVARSPEIARFSRGSRIYWCPKDQADIAGDEVGDNCPFGLARSVRFSDKEEDGREEKIINTKTNLQGDEVGDNYPSGLPRSHWSDKENKSREEKSKNTKIDHEEGVEVGDPCPPGLVGSFWSGKEGKSREDDKSINTKTDHEAVLQQSGEAACKTRDDEMPRIQNQEAAKKDGLHLEATHENNVYKELLSSRVEIVHLTEPDDAVSASNQNQSGSSIQANKHPDQGEKQKQQCEAAANVVLIELSDDEEDVVDDGKQQSRNPLVSSSKQKIDVNARVWNCVNPRGVQLDGPYSMFMLKQWKDASTGPYVAQYRVWREGQSKEEAVLLDEAIRQAYGPNLWNTINSPS